jgi:hypothetical protein
LELAAPELPALILEFAEAPPPKLSPVMVDEPGAGSSPAPGSMKVSAAVFPLDSPEVSGGAEDGAENSMPGGSAESVMSGFVLQEHNPNNKEATNTA